MLCSNRSDVANFVRRGAEKLKTNLEAKMKEITHHIAIRKDDPEGS